MAKQKHNILHPMFWGALRDVVEALERHRIPYAVVGGTAAQLWIAGLLTRWGDLSIDEVAEVSLRLRTTRDVDLSTDAEPFVVLEVLNVLAATSQPPVTVLSAHAARLRDVMVNLSLSPADVSGFSEHYVGFLERARRIRLRRGHEWWEPQVIALADLLATKLSRKGNQAKDLLDVDALCMSLVEAGERVSKTKIEAVLGTPPGGSHLLEAYQAEYQEAFEP